MTGDAIPPSDHVVRYVSPSKYNNGMLDWTALLPREVDAGESSFNWLEYFQKSSAEENLAEVKRTHKLNRRPKGIYAKLNVGNSAARMKNDHSLSREITFVHKPIDSNVSHAVMIGLQHDDEESGAILNGCVIDFMPPT